MHCTRPLNCKSRDSAMHPNVVPTTLHWSKGANRQGLRGLKPLFSQVKVEKKDKKFEFLADFVLATR